ncbi:MAG TPA: hypothetical protein VLK65_32460 [Vicinamibacteria bacterium]|nr:hypothetical protein [Vicinamibacteria bacterium]
MLVFGHIAAATVACRKAGDDVDLRWVVALTLLADVVDKPLGLVVFRETINNGRVWFHSIAVNLALSVVILLWKKRPVYALALWMHQLCDRMWMRPWVALWPFTGAFGYRDLDLEDWVESVLNPYNIATEIIGLAVVAYLAHHYGLFQWERFRLWLRNGDLSTSGMTS